MPTILSQLDAAFRSAIQAAFGIDADPILAVSQNETFGDYQSNAAMGLAKQVVEKTGQKTSPRQVAEQIKAKLDLGQMASEITIAGPGFINVKLSESWLAEQLKSISGDDRLGIPLAVSPHKLPRRVVVDYSGPNIAKQMHVGHLRSTIIGDAIARVIEFIGDEVIRQNHIGDWGTQFGMLISYAKGISTTVISDLERFYREAKVKFDTDEAFQRESRESVVKLQSGNKEVLATWQAIVDETRRHYQPIYERLSVKLRVEHERGESFYNAFLADVVRDLKAKNVAAESDGATVVFVPGYENPLIIQKSDGGYLYGTTDLAAIRYRTTKLGATRIIYTHDSRQAQHFAQVFWTAKQAGWGDGVSLEYAPFGTMLGEDNKPFKTRSGDTVKLKDLLEEAEVRAMALVTAKNPELPEQQRRDIARAVGIGGVKYADLAKDRISDYVFSFDKILALDGNTAPYLQYAYARIRSIFRKSGLEISGFKFEISDLLTPEEIALAKHLLNFGLVLEAAAEEYRPNFICNYLYDLAGRFTGFYENCPVLKA
ncbi:MAG: arginine--tRNA ligase, partial [Tepidisphaeraceae bacterium]